MRFMHVPVGDDVVAYQLVVDLEGADGAARAARGEKAIRVCDLSAIRAEEAALAAVVLINEKVGGDKVVAEEGVYGNANAAPFVDDCL